MTPSDGKKERRRKTASVISALLCVLWSALFLWVFFLDVRLLFEGGSAKLGNAVGQLLLLILITPAAVVLLFADIVLQHASVRTAGRFWEIASLSVTVFLIAEYLFLFSGCYVSPLFNDILITAGAALPCLLTLVRVYSAEKRLAARRKERTDEKQEQGQEGAR